MQRSIVLDLDETLVHCFHDIRFVHSYGIYTDPEMLDLFFPVDQPNRCFDIYIPEQEGMTEGSLWVLKRPHLDTFLKYIHNNFDNIYVWSAGTQTYVEQVCYNLFDAYKCPKGIFSRPFCISDYRGNLYKPLVNIHKLLGSVTGFDLQTTFVLDDRKSTFRDNPENGILIPQWHPSPDKQPTLEQLLDTSDNNLLKLIRWFEQPEVKNAKDVRLLDKNTIFL